MKIKPETLSTILTMFIVLLIPLQLCAQEVLQEIDFEDNIGPADCPFGMKLSPDGSSLFVAICGNSWPLSANNNRIVKIDTQTLSIINEGHTGPFPEEIEFRLDSNGKIELIFVTNSSDGSVSVLKPDLQNEGVVDLGGQFYPFGIIMGPTGRYLYVSNLASGFIFVIDSDPGSSYLKIVNSIDVGGANGRMASFNGKLIIPSSVQNKGAYLKVMDFNNPLNIESVLLDSNLDSYGYPISLNDVVVAEDGLAYVPTFDYFGNSNLFEVDVNASPPVIKRTFDTLLSGPSMYHAHGIGASKDCNTLAVAYFEDSYLKVYSRKSGGFLFSMYLSISYGQLNDALFSKDEELLFVTDQFNSKLYVLTDIPSHGHYLTGEEDVYLNSPLNLSFHGGEENKQGVLFLSTVLGPIVTKRISLDIGWPAYPIYVGLFDNLSNIQLPTLTVPNDPNLQGLTYYFQSIAFDGDNTLRPSNMHTLNIQ